MKIKLSNVRLAFPALFEPKTVNGDGKPAYSAVFLLEAADPQVEEINTALERIAAEKWGAKAGVILRQMRTQDKVALRNGNLKTHYDSFAGKHYISARSLTRPLVIDADKSPLAAHHGRPYAGCHVNASIELWPQDNSYGKRINAFLRGVQFLRDGDAFASGSATASGDDFDDLCEGATAVADLI